ncbi:MAG: DUF4385 family protein, partial [Acidobacteriia bacterium]|nr:DUF4385 family protein [Terriglobia bacterium]
MPDTPSKKRVILESCEALNCDRIGPAEIRAIEDELRRRLGPDRRTSPSYIASVLREAGKQVEYQDRYSDPVMEEPYASRLKGLLQFSDFSSTENSLQQLDAIYQEYRASSDRVGTGLVRRLVQKGKWRAESLATNPRVRPAKRQEKLEIAHWL